MDVDSEMRRILAGMETVALENGSRMTMNEVLSWATKWKASLPEQAIDELLKIAEKL